MFPIVCHSSVSVSTLKLPSTESRTVFIIIFRFQKHFIPDSANASIFICYDDVENNLFCIFVILLHGRPLMLGCKCRFANISL